MYILHDGLNVQSQYIIVYKYFVKKKKIHFGVHILHDGLNVQSQYIIVYKYFVKKLLNSLW